jgi:hypothetical protein
MLSLVLHCHVCCLGVRLLSALAAWVCRCLCSLVLWSPVCLRACLLCWSARHLVCYTCVLGWAWLGLSCACIGGCCTLFYHVVSVLDWVFLSLWCLFVMLRCLLEFLQLYGLGMFVRTSMFCFALPLLSVSDWQGFPVSRGFCPLLLCWRLVAWYAMVRCFQTHEYTL